MKVFCNSASPLYFSLLRMDFTVLACHVAFPAGVGTLRFVKAAAMPEGVFPSRNMA